MEKKYINESRYKKGTNRKRRNVDTIKDKVSLNNKKSVNRTNNIKRAVKTKKKIRKTDRKQKTNNIVTCIILIIIIAIISRAILKDENAPFIPLPFFEESNDSVIKVGIITEDSLLNTQSKNIVINELNKYYKDVLLEINTDYSITYRCLSDVKKVSNKEYILSRNPESNVDINVIKQCLENNINNKESVFYQKLKDIEKINIIDENTLNVELKQDNPYFIYNLDICINTYLDVTSYTQDKSSTDNRLVLNRHKRADKKNPINIIVTKYKDMYEAVEAYKNGKINMFVTNADNVINILGKTEYNIKTYRNGKAVFLVSNPKSELYQKQEIRKAIAYSIDRDSIIEDILKTKGDKIDLPYIYDNIKYKYDVFAAENILLSNGYKKSNKVYSKVVKGVKTVVELNLIVNKKDQIKVNIADRIKNNLSAIGLKVEVDKLYENKLKERIKSGTYDLALVGVELNNNPNISFINPNLYITDSIKNAMNNITNSTIKELKNNLMNLQEVLSEEISAIGIYSEVSYLIYSKEIMGINNVHYMNLFDDILN